MTLAQVFDTTVNFDVNSSNEEVFNVVVKPIVDKSLVGFNGGVLLYGASGSGKEHMLYDNMTDYGIITRVYIISED